MLTGAAAPDPGKATEERDGAGEPGQAESIGEEMHLYVIRHYVIRHRGISVGVQRAGGEEAALYVVRAERKFAVVAGEEGEPVGLDLPGDEAGAGDDGGADGEDGEGRPFAADEEEDGEGDESAQIAAGAVDHLHVAAGHGGE